MAEQNITNEQKTLMEQYANLNYIKQRKLIIQDLNNNYKENVFFKKYSREQIVKFLSAPDQFEQELREMSQFMYVASNHYRRLVDYFGNLATLNYVINSCYEVENIDIKEYKKIYYQTIARYEKYGIKNEVPKILTTVFLEGVFYGIIFETKDGFYIKPIDSKYADISSVEDSVFQFSFDLNYFNTKERRELLPDYGKDFINAYDEYKGNKEKNIAPNSKKRYFEPKNQFCIKFDSSNLLYSLPVFVSLFDLILDLEVYKEIKKDRAVMENYKVLTMEVATDEDGMPKMEFDLTQKYYQQAASNLPEGVGLILSPFKMNDFSLKNTSNTDADYVEEAEALFWHNAGVSSLLFGMGKTPSSSSLSISIKTDEAIIYKLLQQISRVFNLREKKRNPKYLFEIKFLEQSVFNVKEVFENYLKAATYSVPCKMYVAASLGFTPSDVVNGAYLENTVLKLTDSLFSKPLISSNTQSTVDNTGGRPTNEDNGDGLTESGEQTKETSQNDNR